MAVATIGAASLAPVFQSLCDQVNNSMLKNSKLIDVLGFLQSTLNSFRDRVIEPVQAGRGVLYNQNDKIETVVVKLQKGAKLVAKIAKLRSWSFFWLDDYAEKLLELDRYLRILLETTWIEEFRVVRQQNIDVNHLMDAMMLARVFDAYKKAVEAGKVAVIAEPEPVEEERGSKEEVEAVLVVFRRLFEAVREAAERNRGLWMFRYLFTDIESTLYSLQPFLEEMVAHNKVLARPKEEMRCLRVEMEKGVEVVRRSGEVGKKWEGYSKKKYECIGGLLGLNQCLQRQVCVMRRQMSKSATQALDLVRKMERAVNEIVIDGDGIVSNVGVMERGGVSGTT